MNDLLYNVNKAVKKNIFINGNFDFTKIKNIKQINRKKYRNTRFWP